MVTTESSLDASGVCVVIEPNQSLTWRESLVFFTSVAVVSLAVALTFSVMGYWPILPFAGLELAALGAALYWVAQQGRKRQVITVTADSVRIEKGRLRSCRASGGGPESCQEFTTAWVRVRLAKSANGWYPSRLTVGTAGNAIAVGEFLTDEERQDLKARLEQAVASMSGYLLTPPK